LTTPAHGSPNHEVDVRHASSETIMLNRKLGIRAQRYFAVAEKVKCVLPRPLFPEKERLAKPHG
jgi:hypothetical protein